MKTHGFLHLFSQWWSGWENDIGPQNIENNEVVLSNEDVLPDITSTFIFPPDILSFLFLPACLGGKKSPSGSWLCAGCHLWLHRHIARTKILVVFWVRWNWVERVSQESKGASSQGHALQKDGGRTPCSRFNTGKAGVGILFMSGFNNLWNFVYGLRKGCNKSSSTLSKWSCMRCCSCILGERDWYLYNLMDIWGGVEYIWR